jgi:hypothetical protein
MVLPTGTVNHVCGQFTLLRVLLPASSLEAVQLIYIADPKKYALPPSWFEAIEVYPGSEAATVIAKLRQLAGNCRHFQWSQTLGSRSKLLPAWIATNSLPGMGSAGLYIKVRIGSPSGRQFALDWTVVRSGRTLIVINDFGSAAVGTADDPLTLQLTRDAWRRYAATG